MGVEADDVEFCHSLNDIYGQGLTASKPMSRCARQSVCARAKVCGRSRTSFSRCRSTCNRPAYTKRHSSSNPRAVHEIRLPLLRRGGETERHVPGRTGRCEKGGLGAYNDELRRKGKLLAVQALQSVETETTVRVRNGKLSTTDGPFAETK